jgi:hypothetical protein
MAFVARPLKTYKPTVFCASCLRWVGGILISVIGPNAEPGTVVLFQYCARIVASAVFLRDEKFERPRGGHSGELHFDVASFQTFEPLDVKTMRKVWPRLRRFGHVKQSLNPTLYGAFKKRCQNKQKSPLHPPKENLKTE